ncbi:MAG: DUF58 domain-containing protein [Halorubrum sp.]
MPTAALTRRGRIVLGICLVGTVMAFVVGGRSINAVVIPGVVALAAGYVQVSRIEPPGVRRSGLDNGFVGETRDIDLTFHGDSPGRPVERSFVAHVQDRLDDGMTGPEAAVRVSIGDEAARYRVRYTDRGDQAFGPVDVTATDVLGLFEKRLVLDDRDGVVVYPECHPVPAWFRRGLYADEALGESRQREEFDRLREYARGDALRDIHWPATAKHDDLVVKEFAAETEHRRVSVAGGTGTTRTDDAADVLASASASLSLALLDDGIPVELSLPAGDVDVRPGRRGRREVLELAARTGTGTVAESARADVHIEADSADAAISVDGVTVDFADLRSEAAAKLGTSSDDTRPASDASSRTGPQRDGTAATNAEHDDAQPSVAAGDGGRSR